MSADYRELRNRSENHRCAWCDIGDDMVAEIERLRAAAATTAQVWDESEEKLRAENERLRAGMREYACTGTDHPCGCYDQFLSEKAENERLQTANEYAFGPSGELAKLRAENNLLRDRIDEHHKLFEPMRARIERLQAALRRIDGINDNPACYNPSINEVCDEILRGRI